MRHREFPADALRGQAALAERYPDFWRKCDKPGIAANLVWDGDRVVNIDLGSLTLYPYDADRWSAEQEDSYWSDPDRLIFRDPTHCNPSEVSIELLKDMVAALDGPVHDVLSLSPVVDTGYMFVFGIGLGHHIPKLVERAVARHIILIEPLAEFTALSTAAVDWCRIFEIADEKNIKIHFVTGDSPDLICKAMENLVDGLGNTFLDGSYFYNHYFSWQLREVFDKFKKAIKNYYLSTGFFEDEVDMMRNTFDNYVLHDFRVIGAHETMLAASMPAFVVASGPSIDHDIEEIRRLADKAIIISCGTGIRVLMANGIKPDLHVEIENVEAIYRAIEEYSRSFDLSGIVLVGSSTLRSRVCDYFDERWLFYRSGLSSTAILGETAKPLAGASPLVSNAGFSLAVNMGFRDIYLFGVDCGKARHGGEHHSRHSVYFQENFQDLDLLMAQDFENDRVLPGNFGGEFVSGWAYDLSRFCIEKIQGNAQRNLINCSNGVRIHGAKPQVASSIDLSGVAGSKAKVMELLRGQVPLFDRRRFLGEFNFAPHIQGCRDFITEFGDLIEDARRDGIGFFDLDARVLRYILENASRLTGCLMMIRASLRSMIRMGGFIGCRIRDAEKRAAFFDTFLDLYLGRSVSIAEKTIELFEELDEKRRAKLAELEQAS